MKYNEKIDISITGDENSKSEIVYNNIIEGLKEEEKIKYLKSKVTNLELEMKNKITFIILLLASLIGFSIGIYFLIIDLYVLGVISIFLTFIGVMIKLQLMFKNIIKVTGNMEFDRVEHLRKILNSKLK